MQAATTAAPGELETVRAFVNTVDIEAAEDRLSAPADLVAWLRDADLLGQPATADGGDLERALELREALRAALAANHSRGPIPTEALSVLNAAAARAELGVQLTPEPRWVTQPRSRGVDGALGRLLAIITEAMRDGTWSRLKVCVNDTCRWAFYDESRARSGKWCSMQVCGNRAKQQAWRARHSDPPA